METESKLTKLAKCAGCGAKVGAGTLSRLLEGFESHHDERLIVGYDKSDDASVYVIDDNTAIVQTIDFFPPIADDPFLYGQIAATNALSDIYAMGGEPKLALNVMCITKDMDQQTVREILRGGYSKAYEAGAVISGGHTINGAEPIYGLSVTGFVHPKKVLTNSNAEPGDALILTKPLGVGILTTAHKADLVDKSVLDRIYRQMTTLNRAARDIMVQYTVHGCTDVTGFSLLGHSLEMAQGSGCSIQLWADNIPYHAEALELANMGFVPEGAYRNREFAEAEVSAEPGISRAMLDILYDPQTSGGLMIAMPEQEAEKCLRHMRVEGIEAEIIGNIMNKREKSIIISK